MASRKVKEATVTAACRSVLLGRTTAQPPAACAPQHSSSVCLRRLGATASQHCCAEQVSAAAVWSCLNLSWAWRTPIRKVCSRSIQSPGQTQQSMDAVAQARAAAGAPAAAGYKAGPQPAGPWLAALRARRKQLGQRDNLSAEEAAFAQLVKSLDLVPGLAALLRDKRLSPEQQVGCMMAVGVLHGACWRIHTHLHSQGARAACRALMRRTRPHC